MKYLCEDHQMNDVFNDEKELNNKVPDRPHCRYCGHELPYIAKYCPRCGEEQH